MLNFTQNTYYIKADELNMVIVLLKNSNYYCVNDVTDLPKSYKQHTYNKLEDVLSQLKESGNKSTLYLDNRHNLAAKYIAREHTTDIYTDQLYGLPPIKSLLQELMKDKPLMKVE